MKKTHKINVGPNEFHAVRLPMINEETTKNVMHYFKIYIPHTDQQIGSFTVYTDGSAAVVHTFETELYRIKCRYDIDPDHYKILTTNDAPDLNI